MSTQRLKEGAWGDLFFDVLDERAMIRALDGSTVEAGGVGMERARWAFRAWHSGRRTGVSILMSGDAGVNENAPLPDAVVVSEASSGSARLLALADPDTERHPATTFVYVGPYHEIYTTRVGSNIPVDLFVDYLSGLDIVDSPEGISAVPKAGTGGSIELHLGVTSVDGVALVHSFFNTQALSELPSHRGQPTIGGELWRINNPSGVLVANATAATKLEPLAGLDSPAFIALAQSLRVTRAAA